MRRIIASCWKSFSPNTATCGCAMWNSLATTVATPAKWPGRRAPHSGFGELAHLDEGLRAVRVHRADVGAEREVDVGRARLREVAGFVARVARRDLRSARTASG